jgi:hypothetical protein
MNAFFNSLMPAIAYSTQNFTFKTGERINVIFDLGSVPIE